MGMEERISERVVAADRAARRGPRPCSRRGGAEISCSCIAIISFRTGAVLDAGYRMGVLLVSNARSRTPFDPSAR